MEGGEGEGGERGEEGGRWGEGKGERGLNTGSTRHPIHISLAPLLTNTAYSTTVTTLSARVLYRIFCQGGLDSMYVFIVCFAFLWFCC